MKKLKYYILPLIFLIVSSCGFKVENYSKLSNFAINNISLSGDQRINYKIKNGLLFKSNKNSEILLNLDFKTKKTKTIKEKNIKNEITKYKIDISVDVQFQKVNSKEKTSFTVISTSDFNVDGQYSQTINNEKKLIENLSNKITQKIFDKLVQEVNAL